MNLNLLVMVGYEKPLKGLIQKISSNIVTVSTPFNEFGILQLGARMALFKYGNNIVIWSAIPYGSVFEEALKVLTEGAAVNIAYIIVPNTAHYLRAHEYKLKFPKAKIIAPENTKLKQLVQVDCKLGSSCGSKVIGVPELKDLGIEDDFILDNFNFVYMPNHLFQELIVYEKNTQTVFVADLIQNIGKPGLEQYSEITGYSDNYYPHSGLGFIGRFLRVDSFLGKVIMRVIANFSITRDDCAMKAINSLPFNRIVVCHGNIITSNAKQIYQTVHQVSDQRKID